MSHELKHKLDLAMNAETAQASIKIRIEIWSKIYDMAFNENNDKVFDLSEKRITHLNNLLQKQKDTK